MNDEADQVRRLLGRTEYLAAFDAADRLLEEHPGHAALEHLAVLALARSGATETAAARLAASGLLARVDTLDVSLGEDVLALEARIAKDRALAAPTADRARLAVLAAAQYEAAFERFRRTYVGVNAATMWAVAGDLDRAAHLANEVVKLLAGSGDDYWAAATRGEALLLLGDTAGAATALAEAGATGVDIASRASTRRQLDLLCGVLDVSVDVLDALPVPVVLHYCGHLPNGTGEFGRLRGADERRVAREVRTFLSRCGEVIAYGSLAAGADILIAEAVLEAGNELHVMLPFPSEEFIRTSVIPAGQDWLARYRRCLDGAASVSEVTAGAEADDAAYSYCSANAMGSAVIRARFMASHAEQLAVWDGRPSPRIGGTGADVARWRSTGLPATIVPVTPAGGEVDTNAAPTAPRGVRALLFADVKGFSKLRDRHIPAFVDGVLSPLSAVLDHPAVQYRNGWGDALYVVSDDIGVAAEVALTLQETMAALDLEALGLPPLGLRVGMHAGPVFELVDPVRAEPSFFGEHVTRAARIEPIVPPGAVFVTAAFAALLALSCPDGYVSEYVGQVPTAKSFGTMPMHLLRRNHGRAR